MDNHVVIMAGGIGSRFWPMSTPECPKQFIDVMGCGRSLIQLTADRFDGVCPRENMWVVTSEKYIDIVREQLPEIPESMMEVIRIFNNPDLSGEEVMAQLQELWEKQRTLHKRI